MKPEIFMHEFSSKEDILREFEISEEALKDCHVYLAYYHVGDFGCDSSAFVLFEDKAGKLYEVNASHCSCYGLAENDICGSTGNQWEPEETSVEALAHRLKHGSLGTVGGYDDIGYKKESEQVIKYLLGV